METETRPAVELTDSLLVEGSVVLAHRHGHKAMSVAVLTRDELQVFVQQAHDMYGVTADPFATPGSADLHPDVVAALTRQPDTDPWPDHVGYGAHDARCPDPCRHDAECPHGKAWTEGETCAVCDVQAVTPARGA